MLKKRLAIVMAFSGLIAALPALAQDSSFSVASQIAADFEPIAMPDGTMPVEPPPGVGPENMMMLIAQGPPMGGPGGHMPHHGHHGKFDSLSLTDDQYEQMFKIKRDTMARMGAKFSEMMAMHMELRDAMLQPELNKVKLTAIQNRINALQNDISTIRFDSEVNTMAVLTAEQRKDLRREMVKKAAGDGCGMGGGMCGPGGH